MGDATRPIPDGLPSWRAFGAALLRPSRPRLAEALSVATGIAVDTVREALASPTWDWMQRNHQSGISWDVTDPSGRAFPQWAPSAQRWTPPALWESLATRGLLPDRWVDDRSRRFHGGGRAPATVTEAVLLAADAEGIALAEALAREAVLRLRPWFDREPPRTLRWRLLDWTLFLSGLWTDAVTYGPGGEAVGALMRSSTEAAGAAQAYRRPALTAAGVEVAESPNVFRELTGSVASIVSAAEHWTAAARARAVSTGARRVAFESAPDPFEPLLSLWARGYGLLDADSRLTLLLPTFEGHGPPTRTRYGYVPMGRTRPSPGTP